MCSVVVAKVVAITTTIVVRYSDVVVVSQELCRRGVGIAYVR